MDTNQWTSNEKWSKGQKELTARMEMERKVMRLSDESVFLRTKQEMKCTP